MEPARSAESTNRPVTGHQAQSGRSDSNRSTLKGLFPGTTRFSHGPIPSLVGRRWATGPGARFVCARRHGINVRPGFRIRKGSRPRVGGAERWVTSHNTATGLSLRLRTTLLGFSVM